MAIRSPANPQARAESRPDIARRFFANLARHRPLRRSEERFCRRLAALAQQLYEQEILDDDEINDILAVLAKP